MAKKPKFYAVVHGRKLGIFNSWEGGARLSIDRFPEAKHQSFATLALAEEWYR
ncbi:MULTISPECIES: RNase H1/viroplasmin domain-containing protein [Pseudomonas]|uniref:RNase H1/viroplasmin domain-containing protein n=1 Tax=Pseudomonas TaxID=286 RepID=UPI001EE7D3EF|nr:RNase H1/viroplasmin domain-containing protein [Pseudomonas putida]